MTKTLCIALALAGLVGLAGCSSDATANADLEDERAPLAGSSANSLNSPTVGPTSEGLPGGTETEANTGPEPSREARTH